MNLYVNVARTMAIGSVVVIFAALVASAAKEAHNNGDRVITVVTNDVRALARATKGM